MKKHETINQKKRELKQNQVDVKNNQMTIIEMKILARHRGSRLQSQHFGRPRQADHLRLGVQDQPDQHGETLSLLKIQN